MVALFIPVDGRLTSQNPFPGGLTGDALFPVVWPGNATSGNSYAITASQMSAYFNSVLTASPTFVTSGAVYNSVATDTRVLVNKTIGSATSVILAASPAYIFPVLVKDLKGDADTNPITVTFTGGQLIDGLPQVTINNPYGYFWFNPLAAGGWYDAAF